MNYSPQGKPAAVCNPGDFPCAAMGLDHGHIFHQCSGLIEAGADLRLVYDPDLERIHSFQKAFPNVKVARSEDEILEDPEIRLIAAAAVPCERGPLGLRVMDAGKDYFTDKTPFTSLGHSKPRERKRRQPGGNTWCTSASASMSNARSSPAS